MLKNLIQKQFLRAKKSNIVFNSYLQVLISGE